MSSAAGAVARWIAPFLTFAAVAGMCLANDAVPVGSAPAVRLADEVNPLAGAPFYVNPTSAAMRAAQSAGHAPPPPQIHRSRRHGSPGSHQPSQHQQQQQL